MRWVLAAVVVLGLGCAPKHAPPTGAWVVFDAFESGTFWPIGAAFWPEGQPEAAEYPMGGSAQRDIRLYGLGRTEAGWMLPFEVGQELTVWVWAPEHELRSVQWVMRPGENLVEVPLRHALVPEDELPPLIVVEAARRLPPPSKPLSGG